MAPSTSLAREIGLFDATMLVMGGIVGSGIFMNPYVVAGQVKTPALILGAMMSVVLYPDIVAAWHHDYQVDKAATSAVEDEPH